jgi:hypothetical protein
MGNEVSTEFKEFDDKILSMYALGLTTRQIQDHLKDIYAVDVSPELISRVTDEAKELVSEWRGGPQSICDHLWGREGSPMIYRLHKKITGPGNLPYLMTSSSDFVSPSTCSSRRSLLQPLDDSTRVSGHVNLSAMNKWSTMSGR